MRPVICFTSDFGLDDTWVGVCHAVIHRSDAPTRDVVDLSHGVPPYDVRKGAAVAASGVHQLPDAIHLVVVDPGVGGGRRDICVVTEGGTSPARTGQRRAPARGRAAAGGVDAAYAHRALALLERGARTHLPRTRRARAGRRSASRAERRQPAWVPESSRRISRRPLRGVRRGRASYVLGEVLEADRFGSLRFNVPAERHR